MGAALSYIFVKPFDAEASQANDYRVGAQYSQSLAFMSVWKSGQVRAAGRALLCILCRMSPLVWRQEEAEYQRWVTRCVSEGRGSDGCHALIGHVVADLQCGVTRNNDVERMAADSVGHVTNRQHAGLPFPGHGVRNVLRRGTSRDNKRFHPTFQPLDSGGSDSEKWYEKACHRACP